jgi:hypothetical protein
MPDEGSQIAKRWPDVLSPFAGLIHTLCGPAFTEYGLAWGDSARAFRLRRTKRLLEKTQQRIDEGDIKPQAVKFSLLNDIMNHGSAEDNDELQDRWANLLASAADPNNTYRHLVTFPQILSQLTREEALYLEEMCEIENKTEVNLVAPYVDEDAVKEKLDRADYDNLKRLGLVESREEMIPAAATNATAEELSSGKRQQYEPLTLEQYRITSLGYEFVHACRTPKKDTSPREEA